MTDKQKEREARLAERLRANLKRRKDQTRTRADSAKDRDEKGAIKKYNEG